MPEPTLLRFPNFLLRGPDIGHTFIPLLHKTKLNFEETTIYGSPESNNFPQGCRRSTRYPHVYVRADGEIILLRKYMWASANCEVRQTWKHVRSLPNATDISPVKGTRTIVFNPLRNVNDASWQYATEGFAVWNQELNSFVKATRLELFAAAWSPILHSPAHPLFTRENAFIWNSQLRWGFHNVWHLATTLRLDIDEDLFEYDIPIPFPNGMFTFEPGPRPQPSPVPTKINPIPNYARHFEAVTLVRVTPLKSDPKLKEELFGFLSLQAAADYFNVARGTAAMCAHRNQAMLWNNDYSATFFIIQTESLNTDIPIYWPSELTTLEELVFHRVEDTFIPLLSPRSRA